MKLEKIFKKEEAVETKMDPIDEEIALVLQRLHDIEPYDQQYQTVAENLKRLYELKKMNESQEKDRKSTFSIAPDIIRGMFSIAGILLVLHYEELNVIVSKAFPFALNQLGKKSV